MEVLSGSDYTRHSQCNPNPGARDLETAAGRRIFGIAAWILIGRVGVASTNNAINANLDSITAVVIGGTSLFGGRGAVLGTLFGALIVGVYQSGIALAGVQSLYQVLAEGILVIVAVALDQWIRKVRR